MKTLRKYGRTIIAALILALSALIGDADLSGLEGFLTNIVENGGFTVGALAALATQYFGERWVGVFESKEEAEQRKATA